jgi:hypothetical protein
VKPVIAKLDLSGNNLTDEVKQIVYLGKKETKIIVIQAAFIAFVTNISLSLHHSIDQAAKSILHLLRLQVKQVRETKPEDRENAVYLQDISLDKNKSDVYAPDISTVCHSLLFALFSIVEKSFAHGEIYSNSAIFLCLP